jgi:tetratricopeptide (TPR) repeat protein
VANPNDFFSNYYLGITCIFQRKWELAIDFLRTASRIQPNNPDPYFQLGQAYQELQKHDQAIDVLKKSIDLNPNLAQSLLQTGQTEAGRKELQVASELKARASRRHKALVPGNRQWAHPEYRMKTCPAQPRHRILWTQRSDQSRTWQGVAATSRLHRRDFQSGDRSEA